MGEAADHRGHDGVDVDVVVVAEPQRARDLVRVVGGAARALAECGECAAPEVGSGFDEVGEGEGLAEA